MEKTLVVLAAGMGSRFGGLKQIEPVGPSGEFIIDYSVYDALKAGFNKVVFVIRKSHFELFKKTIGERIENQVAVEYVFQEIDDLVKKPLKRTKPFGTSQAVYVTKDVVNGPFVTITSDDYYGPNIFKELSSFMEKQQGLAVVGYEIGPTISKKGAVKRGVILEKDNVITGMAESKVDFKDNKVYCEPLDGSKPFYIETSNPVGMLFYVFNQDIYDLLEVQLKKFVDAADLENDELILTDLVNEYIKNNGATLIWAHDNWIGMTYKEDADTVRKEIQKLIEKGKYPRNLWGIDEKKN